MKTALILSGIVIAASAGINADTLPEEVRAGSIVKRGPISHYIQTLERNYEVPSLGSQKLLYREQTTGNTSGLATPILPPDMAQDPIGD